MTIAILLLLIAAPLAAIAWRVDDWSRDLTTNTAATAHGHADARLRPRVVRADAAAVDAALSAFCDANPAWRRAGEEPLPADSPLHGSLEGEPSSIHHLVRTTGIMGYKDDVWLVVEEAGAGESRLHGDSRSRIGKGDLGQNPRNLKELLAGLRKAIEAR